MKRRTLTKAEALRDFRAYVLPEVTRRYGPRDVPARCEAWNDYVDGLEKDGQITRHQASTWTNPF